MKDILLNFINGITGLLISSLGIYITYLINKHIKNAELKIILTSLNELVKNAVLEVNQVYVEELKKAGEFTPEAQKRAFNECLNKIKTNMPLETKKWLDSNIKDVEAYLKTLIEAQISASKMEG